MVKIILKNRYDKKVFIILNKSYITYIKLNKKNWGKQRIDIGSIEKRNINALHGYSRSLKINTRLKSVSWEY